MNKTTLPNRHPSWLTNSPPNKKGKLSSTTTRLKRECVWFRVRDLCACKSTGPVDRMSHRKWRKTKQQPSRARSGNHINCCLVSLHFQRDIQSTAPVQCLTQECRESNFGPRGRSYEFSFNLKRQTPFVRLQDRRDWPRFGVLQPPFT